MYICVDLEIHLGPGVSMAPGRNSVMKILADLNQRI